VKELTLGDNDTLSVPGDTIEGCRFISQDENKTFSCCYSALARGDDLCDPQRQDERCRKAETVICEEREGSCVIHLLDIHLSDAGDYHVIFPGKLHDNKWIKVKITQRESEREERSLLPEGMEIKIRGMNDTENDSD